jgi:hypothetical protein
MQKPRREFLRMSLGGVGLIALGSFQRTAAFAAAGSPQLTDACKSLEKLILEYARAKDNPWLLIHGIRAFGKGFALNDGSAVDYLCSHYLAERSVNDKAYLFMPLDYEGHPNCFLSEAVLDPGVPLDFAFQRNGRQYTIADVVAGAKALFDPATTVPNDLAWSLSAFAQTTSPEADEWTNANNKQVHFSDVIETALVALERADDPLADAMHSHATERGEAGIDGFFCAGTHLIYGLTTCLRFGHQRRLLTERMKPQFDLLVWRLGVDENLIDRYYGQLAEQYPPELVNIYRLDTKLKFWGHAFEIINYARKFGLFEPSPEQQLLIGQAQERLVGVIDDLTRDDIGKYAGDKVLFNLLIGDACHAYHGLTMGGA